MMPSPPDPKPTDWSRNQALRWFVRWLVLAALLAAVLAAVAVI